MYIHIGSDTGIAILEDGMKGYLSPGDSPGRTGRDGADGRVDGMDLFWSNDILKAIIMGRMFAG